MNAFKSFKDFNEGLEELIKISTKIKDLFESTTYTEKEAVHVLMDYFQEHIPSITEEDYPNTPAALISLHRSTSILFYIVLQEPHPQKIHTAPPEASSG